MRDDPSQRVPELFATFDDDLRPTGLVPRAEVHRRGLWHRAANVFIFDEAGAVLLQQRAASKDVAPGAWDLSAAEHLVPGESFVAGAARGVEEELGMVIPIDLFQAMGEPFRFAHRYGPEVWDREIQQCFAVRWSGAAPQTPDPAEVQRVAWRPWETVRAGPAGGETWTPWLLEGLRRARERLDAFVKVKRL